ncbi:MAG: hypothetical protein M1449_08295, partial [Candidatus Thermoplasmatota archaeon]|nr:hypothetical protein [Candidatus Thermoplasmatota archaeon]
MADRKRVRENCRPRFADAGNPICASLAGGCQPLPTNHTAAMVAPRASPCPVAAFFANPFLAQVPFQ